MSEQTPPLPIHVLLKQLQSPDLTECDHALVALVIRLRGEFERYGRKLLLDDDHVGSATDDTFWKIYKFRGRYQEQGCPCVQECIKQGCGSTCTQQFKCVEKTACKYLWTIHEHAVADCRREIYSAKPWERLDETWPALENNGTSPEAYIEGKFRQEIVQRVWNSQMSEVDRQLLTYQAGPGRPNKARQQAIQQARNEAWARFRAAVKAAFAEEEKS